MMLTFGKRKSYLRCLLDVGSLFAKGLPELRHKESESYYRLLLRTSEPATVPRGLAIKQYSDLAKERGIVDQGPDPDGPDGDGGDEPYDLPPVLPLQDSFAPFDAFLPILSAPASSSGHVPPASDFLSSIGASAPAPGVAAAAAPSVQDVVEAMAK